MNDTDQLQGNVAATPAVIAHDVHLGKDGWLFLIGGSNRVLDLYTTPSAFPPEKVLQWLRLLSSRKERCAAAKIQYLHFFAPEKLSIYFDKFDGDLPFRSRSPAVLVPIEARSVGLDDSIVDPIPMMIAHKEERKLFWQTDTHWTFEGCLCAFQVLCSRLGVDPSPTIAAGIKKSGQVILDLGGKMTPPIKEEFSTMAFLTSGRRVAVNSMVAFKETMKRENDDGLHVGSNVVFCNYRPSAIQKSVVLFGDSFSEYRSHLITGMLAETFREVHFVWSISIDWRYVDRFKPDIVLTEAAERFATNVPDDKFELESYVIRKLAAFVG